MKRFIVLLGLLLFLFPGTGARADNNTFGLAWGISVPTGAIYDYTPAISLRGASAEWRSYYRRDAAYGLNVGWNVFSKSKEGTVSFEDGAVTGKSWNYVNAVPIYVGWFKYLSSDHRDNRWFYGLNAGTSWVQWRTEVGLVNFEEENWLFSVAPEFGVMFPWDSLIGYISARYHYAFPAGNMEAQQYLEIKIGFGMD